MMYRMFAGVFVAAILFAAPRAHAAKPSEVLSEPLKFECKFAPLDYSMRILSMLAKVPIKFGPQVDKNIKITTKTDKGSTFRQGLMKILRPHNLTFRIDEQDTTITIVPLIKKKSASNLQRALPIKFMAANRAADPEISKRFLRSNGPALPPASESR